MKGIEDGTYGAGGSTGNTGSTGTGEVEQGPDTSDPGAYNGGQPDDTVYDPATGEDKAWYPDDYEDVPTEATKPGEFNGDKKDFSGLGYGISG